MTADQLANFENPLFHINGVATADAQLLCNHWHSVFTVFTRRWFC